MRIPRVADTFIKLVKIDSPSGEEENVADFIWNYLQDKVDKVRDDKYGNVYAKINGVGEPVFFAAHMDTVEPGRGIKPQIKNGYITSDGTTILGGDNKIAIACILETVTQLKEKGISHRPLELIFTRSEEVNNYGAINFSYSLLNAKHGYCFDYTNPLGAIITSSPFYERFNLTVTGKEAHASRPKEAINSLLLVNKLLNSVKLGTIDEDTIMNIGVIRGGSVRNTIPGHIYMEGEIRSFVENKLVACKENLTHALDTLTQKEKGEYTIEFVRENGGYKLTDKDSLEYIEKTSSLIKRSGFVPEKVVAWGVSDANIFNEKALLCLNLSDGGEMAHSVEERIKIKNLESLTKIMMTISKG